MAYSTTYATLTAELSTFVEDDTPEFVAALPNIIQRGLDMVQRLLDLDMFRETVTHHVPFNNRIMVRRDGLKVRSLFLTKTGDHIQQRSFDFCRAYLGKGQPLYWCERTSGDIYLAPTPDQNYTCEIEMLMKPTALSDASPTNWITENCSDLLLLACLIESEQFLAGPERVAEFTQVLQVKASQYAETFRGQGRTAYTPIRASAQADQGRI